MVQFLNFWFCISLYTFEVSLKKFLSYYLEYLRVSLVVKRSAGVKIVHDKLLFLS